MCNVSKLFLGSSYFICNSKTSCNKLYKYLLLHLHENVLKSQFSRKSLVSIQIIFAVCTVRNRQFQLHNHFLAFLKYLYFVYGDCPTIFSKYRFLQKQCSDYVTKVIDFNSAIYKRGNYGSSLCVEVYRIQQISSLEIVVRIIIEIVYAGLKALKHSSVGAFVIDIINVLKLFR